MVTGRPALITNTASYKYCLTSVSKENVKTSSNFGTLTSKLFSK